MKNTIVISGKGVKREFVCGEELYPGMLADFTKDEDGILKIVANTGADYAQPKCFVTEYEGYGKTILDKYNTGKTAIVYFAQTGDIVYARINNSVPVIMGDKLINNNGLLEKDAAPGSNMVVAVALEDATETEEGSGIYFAKILIL